MADSQRKTENLFNGTLEQGSFNSNTGAEVPNSTRVRTTFFSQLKAGTYVINCNGAADAVVYLYNTNDTSSYDTATYTGWQSVPLRFNLSNDKYVRFAFRKSDNSDITPSEVSNVMLNSGSTAKPYEPYWKHSLRKLTTSTEAVENPLYSDGTPITAYTIKGNTVQNGTLTPSNPVDVNGVGVRTENIYNKYNVIDVPNLGTRYGQYVPKDVYSIYNNTDNVVYWGVNNMQSRFEACEPHSTATVNMTGTYSNYGFFMPYNDASLGDVTIVQGSTAPDHYIPYGYKIPISTNQQTTNIYLGSTQTVRQIKKLVLTGDENWAESACSIGYRFNVPITNAMPSDTTIGVRSMCTHQQLTSTGNTYNTLGTYTITGTPELIMTLGNDTRLASWKSWLADQYANGTPVTVWYVLATPETGIVNEPLMKIGTYADSLSNATAIPTTEGANSITVDTTVQPSEFTATWTGWHDAEVKEKSRNLFDVDGTIYRYGLGENNTVAYSPNAVMFCFKAKPNTNYACKVYDEHSTFLRLYRSDNPLTTPEESNTIVYTEMVEQESSVNPQVTINSGNSAYIWLQVSGTWYSTYGGSSIMFNEGSTALPYEPYWK